jgi:hypothetical protein
MKPHSQDWNRGFKAGREGTMYVRPIDLIDANEWTMGFMQVGSC